MECNSIAMPARSLTSVPDTTIYGPARNIVQGYTYGDVSATFYCHNDMREKKFFETWQRIAFNPQTWSMGYYDDYVGKIEIYSLDNDGGRRYGVQLVECFPKTISAQNLDANPSSTPQTCEVSFSYRYWKNLTDEANLPKPIVETFQRILANQVERELTRNIPKVLRKL